MRILEISFSLSADLTCAGYGGIHWAVIVVLFVVGFLCNVRLSGSWILAALGKFDYLTRDYYDRNKVAGFGQFRHVFLELHFSRSL